MIKNIIFDFDGVICESVNIKTDAFYEMYLPYGAEIALKVKEHHLANGGMSRFEKFKLYEESFLEKILSDEKMSLLSSEFSTIVKEKIIKAPFVDGVLEFLEQESSSYKCFIVSATPMDEMKDIAKEKKIDKYFLEMFGSPKNKIEWGKYILEKYQINNKETLFIGDALSDYNAAKEHKMHFLLRETPENFNLFQSDIESVKNFVELKKYLR